MEIKHDNLWFCEECFCVSETGDESSLHYYYNEVEADEKAANIWAGVERLQSEYKGHLVSNNDSETGEGIDEFSHTKSCACCKTNLGGKFYCMAIIG